MKKDVVVGLGEIGTPILKLFSKNSQTIGYDINNLGIFLSLPRGIQTTSFVIHKLAEGFIIPLFYHKI